MPHPYESFHELLRKAGIANQISSSVYDTAWVARLSEHDAELAKNAARWLLDNRLPDGGWGTKEFLYGHDRFISTLATMIALNKHGWDNNVSLQTAREALEKYTKHVLRDPAGATIAFEMIVPTLIAEARHMNLISRADNALTRGLERVRIAKLKALSGHKFTRRVNTAFMSEVVRSDLHLLDIDNLQHENGSVECSPSATAFFALQVRAGDAAALDYLQTVSKATGGSVPYLWPLEVFECTWVLWNLALVGLENLDNETLTICQRGLNIIEKNWSSKDGVSAASGMFPDMDTTGMALNTLIKYGRNADINGMLFYETDSHFCSYPLENDPSTSANIHALWALQATNLGIEHPTVQKVVSFLRRTRTGRLFWIDKWHTSPYYATSHAAMVLLNYDKEMAEDAMYWIRETQNEDGAWGFYDVPTAEETAYALQALTIWKRRGGEASDEVLKRGADWLAEHADPPYPPLWTGKTLYCPTLIVRSAILSALMLTAK